MMIKLRLLFCIIFLINTTLFFAQVVINEACSKNETVIFDEFGNYADWVELYNSGNEAVNLTGYYLSDDPDNAQKWSFPNVEIGAHDFLFIFASGNDEFAQFIHSNFKLSKDGETLFFSNPAGLLLETFELPALNDDESYGRQIDGSESLYFFETPTPAASNNESIIVEFAPKPQFSLEARFFDEAVSLTLNSELPDFDIRYTTDGSLPDEFSFLYESPILMDTTICIRAACFGEGFRPSSTITQTYFIGTNHKLPVVALSSSPENYWSWEEGILIDGPNIDSVWPYLGANYWLDIEIPAHFEYFDENGHFEIGYDLGLKVHGGRGGRTHPQKPLRLLAKKKYGSAMMDYPFFKDRENTKYKRLVLRNGSGDFNVAHFRDGMAQRMYIREGLDVDGLAYQPVAVYLNGIYYGLLNLREKADEYYLQNRFGVEIDKLDLLEEDTFVVKGNYEFFDEHYAFITENDLSEEANYQKAASYFDVEALIDYHIGETAINNADSYGNNIKYWRERKEGSKWRYMLFDLEAGLNRYGWTNANADVFGRKMTEYQDTNRHVNILKSFLNNEGFRFNFINRYADMLNMMYREENMRNEVIYSRDLIAEEMKRHFLLYTWPGYDVWWNERMAGLFDFAADRPTYARQYLQDYFQLPGQVQLQLKTYPENAGKITLNTIQPDLPWDGYYFNGVPVNLTIEANDGFQFSHWQSLKTIKTKNSNTSIRYNFEDDDEIVAYFKAEYEGLDLSIYPNLLSAGTPITLSFLLDEIEEVEIQVLDAAGRLVQAPELIKLNGGRQAYSLKIGNLPKGSYLLTVKTSKVMETRVFFVQ